jgi:hypothetical protein
MCGMFGRITKCAPAAVLLVSFASQAGAQSGDEVIVDPELAGPSKQSPSRSDGDETIVDPELAGSGGGRTSGSASDNGWGTEATSSFQGGGAGPTAAASEEDEYDPQANTGLAKIEVVGQQGVDIHRENYLEDFFESRLRFGAETDFRISRKLRLSTGARLDFFFASPHPQDEDIPRPGQPGNVLYPNGRTASDYLRYETDIIPLSMFLDSTLRDGVHLRVGVQPVSLARMDFISPVDMLAVYDLRPSPKADPSGMKMSQMAVRLDWDMSTWATLQLLYVPWFMPHFARGNQDRFVGAAFTGIRAARQENPYLWLLSASQQPQWNQSTLRYAGPAPDFAHPQAEARLNMRGSSYELALFGGTALEKTPFVYFAPVVSQYLGSYPFSDETQSGVYQEALSKIALGLANNAPIIDVQYPRYYLVGVDGSFDIAPLSFGFEAGWSPSRVLYTVTRDGSAPPMPNTTRPIKDPSDTCLSLSGASDDPAALKAADVRAACSDHTGTARDNAIRAGVPLVVAAAHVDYVNGDRVALVAEAFLMQAFEMPYDRNRDWAGFLPGTGTLVGGVFGGSYSFDEDSKYRIAGSVVALPGPSIIAMPMVELKLDEGLWMNLGLQLYEGPQPGGIPNASASLPFPTHLTAGGVYSGYDQVTLGFRWLPGG